MLDSTLGLLYTQLLVQRFLSNIFSSFQKILFLQIFQELESPNEKNALETHLALLITKREVFLETATNESTDNSNFREVSALFSCLLP